MRFMIDGFRRLRFVVADPEMSAGGRISRGGKFNFYQFFRKIQELKMDPEGKVPEGAPWILTQVKYYWKLSEMKIKSITCK